PSDLNSRGSSLGTGDACPVAALRSPARVPIARWAQGAIGATCDSRALRPPNGGANARWSVNGRPELPIWLLTRSTRVGCRHAQTRGRGASVQFARPGRRQGSAVVLQGSARSHLLLSEAWRQPPTFE